jgi:hypothetical protein
MPLIFPEIRLSLPPHTIYRLLDRPALFLRSLSLTVWKNRELKKFFAKNGGLDCGQKIESSILFQEIPSRSYAKSLADDIRRAVRTQEQYP